MPETRNIVFLVVGFDSLLLSWTSLSLVAGRGNEAVVKLLEQVKSAEDELEVAKAIVTVAYNKDKFKRYGSKDAGCYPARLHD